MVVYCVWEIANVFLVVCRPNQIFATLFVAMFATKHCTVDDTAENGDKTEDEEDYTENPVF